MLVYFWRYQNMRAIGTSLPEIRSRQGHLSICCTRTCIVACAIAVREVSHESLRQVGTKDGLENRTGCLTYVCVSRDGTPRPTDGCSSYDVETQSYRRWGSLTCSVDSVGGGSRTCSRQGRQRVPSGVSAAFHSNTEIVLREDACLYKEGRRRHVCSAHLGGVKKE